MELLTPITLSDRVPDTSPEYWAQQRFKGRGPKYLKISERKVLYRWSDVEAWLTSTERMGTRVPA